MTTAITVARHAGQSDATSAHPLTTRSYRNPVPYDDGRAHTAPDPFVIEFRGRYYCYATHERGICVSYSPDLVHWRFSGFAYTEAGRKNFWAPSVVLINGLFHMYFSNMPDDESNSHAEIMRVAVSDDPLGPFEKRAELFSTFAIDSQVVLDEDNILYLLYADNQVTGLSETRPGTSVMVDRLKTPLARAGSPSALIVPTMDEEIFARNRFGDGRDWHTVEGATYFKYRDQAYITYSANSYEHEDYFVGYAQATLHGVGRHEHIDQLPWRKHLRAGRFDPLLIRSGTVEGTGHNSIVKAPNHIDDWIVYHGRNASDELYVGSEQRVMRIDPLYYAEGGLDTIGPTDDEQDMPLQPDILIDFSTPLPDGWKLVDGTYAALADGQGHMAITGGGGRFVLVSPPGQSFSTYEASVWCRAEPNPLGVRFGMVLRYADRQNFSVVQIASDGIHVVDTVDGIEHMTQYGSEPLHGIDWTAWHSIGATRVFDRVQLRIDGIARCEIRIEDVAGRIGLCALGGNVAFSSFAVTDHVNLWGESFAAIGREISVEDSMILREGLRSSGAGLARFATRKAIDGRRYVLDFAMDSERGQVAVMLGPYRLAVHGNDARLSCSDRVVASHPQPDRLRQMASSLMPCCDDQGRTLATVRITSANGDLRIHMRNRTWQAPIDDANSTTIACAMGGSASLVGYTRTSLGTTGR